MSFGGRAHCRLVPAGTVYEIDPDILKLNLHTKNEFSRSKISKEHYRQTDRQTDRCD